jgi:outer membrane lipoprotein SlyB
LSVHTGIDRIRWIPYFGTALAGCHAGEDGQAVINRGDGIEVELPSGNGRHHVLS